MGFLVCIATGWTARVRFPVGTRHIPVFHEVKTGYEAHPASHPMETGGFSLGVKRPGHEADHSPPSSAEVKNGGAIPPLPQTSS
jgi:hypothetical protein